MKSYDVWADNMVNVMLPDGLDPNSQAGISEIYRQAIPLLIKRLADEASLHWKRYRDGDTNEGGE